MPKHHVSDLITDQEMAFARLVLSGTKTDREAAQEVGLNPDTAAYTKAKPRVRAYMLEHRAAMQQQLAEQLAAQQSEAQRQLSLCREQALECLWEIAKTKAEMTRGSLTAQVKAMSMIVAIVGLIPGHPAGSATPGSDKAQIYAAEWLAKQQEKAIDPKPSTAIVQEEVEPGLAAPEPAAAGDAPPFPDIPIDHFSAQTTAWSPSAPLFAFAPDAKAPFSTKNNPFVWRR